MPETNDQPAKTTKIGQLLALMRRPEGASISALVTATGWQSHSIRGAIAGTIKKKLGHTVEASKGDAGTIYRIAAEADLTVPAARRPSRKKARS